MIDPKLNFAFGKILKLAERMTTTKEQKKFNRKSLREVKKGRVKFLKDLNKLIKRNKYLMKSFKLEMDWRAKDEEIKVK